MSEHDPLCRQQHWDGGDCFDCRLIAKVRADEREDASHRTAAALYHSRLADLRAKVEALPGAPASGSGWIARDDVLALLDEVP